MSRKRKPKTDRRRPANLPTGMTTRPGRPGYYADFIAHGRRVQDKLSDDFDTACRVLRRLRADADASDFGLVDNHVSLAEIRDAYLKAVGQEQAKQTHVNYTHYLQPIIDWLAERGVVRVGQLTPIFVMDYREHRTRQTKRKGKGKVSAATVNLEVLVFGAMLNWAVKPARLIASNPLSEIQPLPHDEKKGRALTETEIAQLLEASPQPWRDIWYAFLNTGLRSFELANLTWVNVDWESRELTVLGKGRKYRLVPITDGLFQTLDRLWAATKCERVFVNGRNQPLTPVCIYQAFHRHCQQARIETHTYDETGGLIAYISPHRLRTTFATHAITQGADPRSVQEILGHETLAMTMGVYAKVQSGHKRAAVDKLSYGQGASNPDVLPLSSKETGS